MKTVIWEVMRRVGHFPHFDYVRRTYDVCAILTGTTLPPGFKTFQILKTLQAGTL